MRLALALSLILAAPRSTPPVPHWSADGRSFLLTTKDIGPATVEETTIIDLWTGEREVIERLTSTCDFHGDVDEQVEVQRCRKTLARAKAAYAKRMAALLPRRTAPPVPSTGLPIQVTPSMLIASPPGRPSHRVPVVDATPERVSLYPSSDGQWALATVAPAEGGHAVTLVVVPLVARVEVRAASEAAAEPIVKTIAASGFAGAHVTVGAMTTAAPLAVCFLPGFEPEAAQIAEAVGLRPEAATRCAEATPYGLTVFVAGQR